MSIHLQYRGSQDLSLMDSGYFFVLFLLRTTSFFPLFFFCFRPRTFFLFLFFVCIWTRLSSDSNFLRHAPVSALFA